MVLGTAATVLTGDGVTVAETEPLEGSLTCGVAGVSVLDPLAGMGGFAAEGGGVGDFAGKGEAVGGFAAGEEEAIDGFAAGVAEGLVADMPRFSSLRRKDPDISGPLLICSKCA